MFRRGEHEARPEERPRVVEAPDSEAQPPGSRASNAQTETVVAKGAKLAGTVVAGSLLRVDGELEGTITAEGDVILSPGSKVEADIVDVSRRAYWESHALDRCCRPAKSTTARRKGTSDPQVTSGGHIDSCSIRG